MEDISPSLLAKIRTSFRVLLGDDRPVQPTYAAAGDYAARVGGALAAAIAQQLSGGVLPDGKMYWNIAAQVIKPLLEEDYNLSADAAAAVQKALNEAAGIGLAVQTVPPDAERIDGILQGLCAAEQFDDGAAHLLSVPVLENFSRSAVDETLRRNVEAHARAGLHPRIVRTAESRCCPWCAALAGVYDYPDVPKDIYRRHTRCRCTVEYDPATGRRQNVWTRRWAEHAPPSVQKNKLQNMSPSAILATENQSQTEGPAEKMRISVTDVTQEYLANATPGHGIVHYDAGYKIGKHKNEAEFAEWLYQTFGGEIHAFDERDFDAPSPDYQWNGKLWELKNTSTANATDNAVKKALKQISDNPGGIILAYEENDISDTIFRTVKRRIERGRIDLVDVIFVYRKKLVKILRHKNESR